MMTQPIAHVRVRWLGPTEGGRSESPRGTIHATTARLAGDSQQFSVILQLPQRDEANRETNDSAELTLLAADLLPDIAERIRPGARFVIYEGRRSVAECEVLSVRTGSIAGKPV